MEQPTERLGATVAVNSLEKYYNREAAVSNVTLSVEAGEFVSLIGPSGSGKTTTLMMIAGFTQPDSGTILFNRKDITALPAQKRGFGMVFQNYAIFPHLTVYENVAFPLRVRREPEDAIAEKVGWALKSVKLESMAQRYSRQLSGGQQQRVALARAIVYNPQVILMDEPLGALDKNLRYHMQVEIKELQQRLGTTVIYVTHDQEEAMNMSDRIMVMNNGCIEQVGSPTEVYERPATPFVAKFLGEANLIPIRLEKNGSTTSIRRLCDGRHLLGPKAQRDAISTGYLLVRPERIQLKLSSMASQSQDLSIPGKIRRVSFLGNIVRCLVDTGDAEPIIVDLKNGDRQFDCSPGSSVSVAWDAKDARVIPQ